MSMRAPVSYEQALEQVAEGPTNLAQVIGQFLVRCEDDESAPASKPSRPAANPRLLAEIAELREAVRAKQQKIDADEVCMQEMEAEIIQLRGQKERAPSPAMQDARAEIELKAKERAEALLNDGEQRPHRLTITDRLCDEIERLHGELEAMRSHPATAPCPVCSAIKVMVLGSVGEPVTPMVAPKLSKRGKGYGESILRALAAAGRPIITDEIAEITGLPPRKVTTNVLHLTRIGLVRKIARPGASGGKGYRYRYTLANKEEARADSRN